MGLPVKMGRLSAVDSVWARKILPSVWWLLLTFFVCTLTYLRCGPLAGEVRNDDANDDERFGGGIVGDVGEVGLSTDDRTGDSPGFEGVVDEEGEAGWRFLMTRWSRDGFLE
jgi:hypothetical protein